MFVFIHDANLLKLNFRLNAASCTHGTNYLIQRVNCLFQFAGIKLSESGMDLVYRAIHISQIEIILIILVKEKI